MMDLIRKKHAASLVYLHDPQCTTEIDAVRSILSTVQLKLRKMQDSLMSTRTDKIQGFVDKNNMKNLYSSRKEVYGPTNAGPSPLLCADGTKLISAKNMILEKWAKHFDAVLNRPSCMNDKAIERLPQAPVNESLNVTPTLGEVHSAIC